MHYFYLHGFASGPGSAKAVFLGDRFQALGLALQIPDLNQGNFTQLTLTRQIRQIQTLLPSAPVTLIGSSLGGLTATWVAQRQLQVERLILLAPAFSFLDHWLPQLGATQLQQWQTQTHLEIYHYAEQRFLPLSYEFIEDAAQYCQGQFNRSLPTLVLHGLQDQVIPIQASRDYVADRPWATLQELESDHSLSNVKPLIWQAIQNFCQLSLVTENRQWPE